MNIYQRMLESAGAVRAPELGGAPAAPAAPAPAPASVFNGAPAPAPAAPAEPPIPTAPAEGWFGKLTPEDRTWAESKGWKQDTDPFAIVQSYQNLEKLFGADKAGRTLVLPKDETDKAALDAIYDKLGRPKAPAEYKIDAPAGADPAFTDAARGWFHKAGLTQAQAAAVSESYKALELDAVQRVQVEHEQQVAGLQKEWGAQFDQKVETAKAALKAASITEQQTKEIERAVGPAVAAKLFEFFGRNYTEAGPPSGENRSAPGFTSMTPAAANAKMDQLRTDPNFMARYGHADPKIREVAINEMDALAKIAVNNRV